MRTIRSFQIKDFRVNAMVVYVKRCFYLGKHSSLSSSVLQPFKEITCFGSTVMGVMGQWYVNCNFGSLFSFLGWRIYCPLFASLFMSSFHYALPWCWSTKQLVKIATTIHSWSYRQSRDLLCIRTVKIQHQRSDNKRKIIIAGIL